MQKRGRTEGRKDGVERTDGMERTDGRNGRTNGFTGDYIMAKEERTDGIDGRID